MVRIIRLLKSHLIWLFDAIANKLFLYIWTEDKSILNAKMWGSNREQFIVRWNWIHLKGIVFINRERVLHFNIFSLTLLIFSRQSKGELYLKNFYLLGQTKLWLNEIKHYDHKVVSTLFIKSTATQHISKGWKKSVILIQIDCFENSVKLFRHLSC